LFPPLPEFLYFLSTVSAELILMVFICFVEGISMLLVEIAFHFDAAHS
jgi:hypothetical protein